MISTEAGTEQLGQLTQRVFEFLQTMEQLVSEAKAPVSAEYWAPLEQFVAVDDFERLVPEDAFPAPAEGSGDDPWSRTVMDWEGYRDCFGLWASTAPKFENAVQRITEFPGLVYLEIEEHHIHGDAHHTFNSVSVYELNDEGKIYRIRVAGAAGRLITAAGSK